jgi:hypothetical protein
MIVRTAILSLFVLAAMPAFAQQPSELDKEVEALREYCKPDIERLCSKVEPGGGQIKKCLMEHKKNLEVGCAEALAKLKK